MLNMPARPTTQKRQPEHRLSGLRLRPGRPGVRAGPLQPRRGGLGPAGLPRVDGTPDPFARVITFDKRGSGMSDAVMTPPTLEQRMADVGAVMDAVGCRTAWLLGVSEGGPMSILFRGNVPRAHAGLVLWGTYARYCRAPTTSGGQRKRPSSTACGSGRRFGEIPRELPGLRLALR
jgi:Predicted hydrolases or acyltransferases (alpha/beta hydrolase superfamily)